MTSTIIKTIFNSKIAEYFSLQRFNSDFAISINNIVLIIRQSFGIFMHTIYFLAPERHHQPRSLFYPFRVECFFTVSCSAFSVNCLENYDDMFMMVDIFVKVDLIVLIVFVKKFCSLDFSQLFF